MNNSDDRAMSNVATLTFLGSGSAFFIGNYHSNMLLEYKNEKLLIDCGSDIRFSLNELGFNHHDIKNVFISHLHGDHVGGLEWLAFMTKFDPSCQKPFLYVCETTVDDLWNHVLSGGLSSIENITPSLSTYFDVHVVNQKNSFLWQDITFNLIQTLHFRSNFKTMPTHGLLFYINGKTVWISNDTQFTPESLKPYYEESDIIFHDCETSPYRSSVHAHYLDLVTLPLHVKNKMWLYHYNMGPLPDCVKDGFKGFIKKGQVFEL
jgi:ribonuclease BN (tRNA processing enzyme)